MRWGIIAALILWCGVGLAQKPAADAAKEAFVNKTKAAIIPQRIASLLKIAPSYTPNKRDSTRHELCLKEGRWGQN